MVSEYDFYMNLYDSFIKTNNVENDKIIWKMNSIIKLMKLTEGSDEGEFCETGLRMIMSLFRSYQFDSCDIKSKDFDNSLIQQKEIVIPILREEFI
ncbi:MAG: hypothetical protein ACFE8M_02150 [Candidatus Hermodarchaeota archaeon]